MNTGDFLFQTSVFAFFFVICFFVFISFLTKKQQTNKSNNIEKKLDRIIELLEKDINN